MSVTKKGEILCEAVQGTLLASPEMTAEWEKYLKKIGHNEGDQLSFLRNIEAFIQKLLNVAPGQVRNLKGKVQEISDEQSLGVCPSCQKGRIKDKGKLTKNFIDK